MSAALECPGPECWQALVDNTAAPEQWQEYERHVESCAACQERLRRGEEWQSELRSLGRRVGDPTLVPSDPTLIQVRERLCEAKGQGRTVPPIPADLSFLRPAERPDLLGRLGDYEVLEVIGEGGMGIVLKAFEPALHRLVAIKVVGVAGSAIARRRFTREAQAAAAVCHDHIVTVHGVQETDGLPYLVMQYVAGESLQDRLDRIGPLEVAEIVRIGLQTASGLAAAHAQGLIHRDIKPANLLLENGLARVKITDFGLARMVDDVGLTQDGVVAGTPEYMAPEQACGEPIDHRADLFSLGSVLYAMCTGVPPFRGESSVAVLRQVSDLEPTPIRALNPDIPAWLEAFVKRLMAKSPADRFQTAAEVASLLENYLAYLRQPGTLSAPAFATRSIKTRKQGDRETRRRRLVFLLLVSLSPCLLVLLLAWWLAGGAGAGGTDPNAESPQEYFHSFKGDGNMPPDFNWDGLDAGECVQFEEEGLRLTLPAGHEGKRMGTGLASRFPVKGDFEITVRYEILHEPEAANAGQGTALYLWVDSNTPVFNRAMLMRGMGTAKGKHYSTWMVLKNVPGQQPSQDAKHTLARATSGRLRLVRSGPVLSQYVAEGNGDEFTFLWSHQFGEDDIKPVRIGGFTGGAKASLEVRFTDLVIKAGSVPDVPAAAGPHAAGERRGILVMVLAAFLALILTLAIWLSLRRRPSTGSQKAAAAPASEPAAASAPASVSFSCSGCGKNLKTRAELAGKKVKCPQCGQGVQVPETNTGIVARPPI